MRIGIPKEVKEHEYRVAVTPAGVHALVEAGHTVLVQAGAGVGAGFPDAEYVASGARIVPDAADAWAADLVCKIKEPLPQEYPFLRRDLLLFTYLHLAASRSCTDALLGSRPTTYREPTFRVHESLFFCVANMPGAVPVTSTLALTAVTFPYLAVLASRGWEAACRADRALARGLNTHDGALVHAGVAAAHGLPVTALDDVLA